MELIFLIASIVLNLVLGFFVYNLYQQNVQFESYISNIDKKESKIYAEAEKYYLAFLHLFTQASTEMDRIDKKGSFSSDDEVGFGFKIIHTAIKNVVEKLQELKDEQQDNKVEFLVYGHDKKGKGKIVSVMAENSRDAINIAREENKNCKFNHANTK